MNSSIYNNGTVIDIVQKEELNKKAIQYYTAGGNCKKCQRKRVHEQLADSADSRHRHWYHSAIPKVLMKAVRCRERQLSRGERREPQMNVQTFEWGKATPAVIGARAIRCSRGIHREIIDQKQKVHSACFIIRNSNSCSCECLILLNG